MYGLTFFPEFAAALFVLGVIVALLGFQRLAENAS